MTVLKLDTKKRKKKSNACSLNREETKFKTRRKEFKDKRKKMNRFDDYVC